MQSILFLARSFVLLDFEDQMASNLDKPFASSDISYSRTILRTMNEFRRQGILCDVIITVRGGRKYIAHSTVLAASSQYFRKLFAFNSNTETRFQVQVHWVYSEVMEVILEYIYTGKINLTEENAEVILTASDYFVVEGLQDVVVDFLQEHLNVVSCCSVLSLADDYSLQVLKSSCNRFISNNFAEATKSQAFFCLPMKLLKELISRNDLVLASEKDIFCAVVRWVNHNFENRASHFADLFSCIRLQDIPKEFLSSTVVHEALVQENATCMAHVLEVMNVGDVSHASAKIRSNLESVDVVVLCGGTSSKYVTQNFQHTACFVPSSNKWLELPNMLCGQTGHATAVCNGLLYSTGHHSIFNQEASRLVQCYVSGDRKWVTCASMPVGRSFAAAVTLQGQLYVLGGVLHKDNRKSVSAAVSRYNPAVERWYAVTGMNCARQGLCAVVFEGSIFAIGGRDIDDNFLSTVERYEPQRDQWALIGSMVKRRAFASATVINGKVLVIGGRENAQDSGILNCCETFNPATGQWSLEPYGLCTARCSAGICGVGNKVFLFGGESEDDALDSVECWDVQERQWSIVTHMPFNAFHIQAELLRLPKNTVFRQ